MDTFRYALLLEYEGTEFSGWQIQPEQRTVQGELELALKTVLRQAEVKVIGAGRTDAGVHATGMVAHFASAELIEDPSRFLLSINSLTGDDFVTKDLRAVPEHFHARYSALSRSYRYTIEQGRSALHRRIRWHSHRALDLEALIEATSLLVGAHDFTSFSKDSEDVEHYRCTIHSALWEKHGTCFVLSIKANRFVRGMVRALVGSLTEVGMGKLSMEHIRSMLQTPSVTGRARFLAPAHGLVFERVEYPSEFGLWS